MSRAIELLKKLRQEIKGTRKAAFSGGDYYSKRLKHFVDLLDQALAELKQPPAGDFTKRFREFLIEAYKGEAISSDIYTQGLDACTRLDHAEKRILVMQVNRNELFDETIKQAEEIEGLKKDIIKMNDKCVTIRRKLESEIAQLKGAAK